MSTLYLYNTLNMFRKMKPFHCYRNKNKNTTPATLCRILDLAENDALSRKNKDDQIKITMLSPTNATGNITDEDSGNKDGSGTINNLTGSMLLASAKLDHERSTTTEDDNEPAKKKPKKKVKKPKQNWVNTNLASFQAPWIPANAHMNEIKAKLLSLLGYFKFFFANKLKDLIVVETNRYTFSKNGKLMVTKNNINCFLRILILSVLSNYKASANL